MLHLKINRNLLNLCAIVVGRGINQGRSNLRRLCPRNAVQIAENELSGEQSTHSG
jgi:hypothetical protein